MATRSKTLPARFFSQPADQVAKNLLGAFLFHETPEGITSGRIVETEAYLSADDPACHAHRGVTTRTEVMFGPAGRSYVYFIYGMYFCVNVVTGKVGHGEAVLIRALQPVEGIQLMMKRRLRAGRRQKVRPQELCNGPGKLCVSMGIGKAQNNVDLKGSSLRVLRHDAYGSTYRRPHDDEILITPRIGISLAKDLPLRFLLK